MKNGKNEKRARLARLTALMLLFALAALALTACLGGVDTEGTATVVIATDSEHFTAYEIPLSEVEGEEGAYSLLEYLRDKKGVALEAVDGVYGKQLLTVGEVVQNESAAEYIYVWTSNEADFDTSAYATTVEYGGRTLVSSGINIASMSAPDGVIIFISYYQS